MTKDLDRPERALRGISLNHNTTGVSVNNGSRTVIEGNSVVGRRLTAGVFLFDSSDSVVSANTFSNNLEGLLVRGSSARTTIRGNTAEGNRVGIVVESSTTGNQLTGNRVNGNPPGDGIRALSPATTLRGNRANANGNWGIFAVNGVTDGGGNSASGNGNPAQCTPNISC